MDRYTYYEAVYCGFFASLIACVGLVMGGLIYKLIGEPEGLVAAIPFLVGQFLSFTAVFAAVIFNIRRNKNRE